MNLKIRETLQRLAHYVVRNEIVCEDLFEKLGISREDFSDKVNENDEQLKESTLWHNRFPGLFFDSP